LDSPIAALAVGNLQMKRCLAAILAADVVGYSRVMERTEADTFERLLAHRKELFEPEIDRHHDRAFKLMGDGLLAEFASVVDAVECAAAIQKGMATRNAGLAADLRIECRIGVNLGDVIIGKDGDGVIDLHGDGVIIAHRLQALGEPGDVRVSGIVYEQVKKKITAGFESLGDKAIKSIAEPVRVYRVLMDPSSAGATVDLSDAMAKLIASAEPMRRFACRYSRSPRCYYGVPLGPSGTCPRGAMWLRKQFSAVSLQFWPPTWLAIVASWVKMNLAHCRR